MAESEMVSDFVRQERAVAGEGVVVWRAARIDEALPITGERVRLGRRRLSVGAAGRSPKQGGERRRHVELEDRHLVIRRASQELILMADEVRLEIAKRIAAVPVAVARLAELNARDAREAALPDLPEAAVRTIALLGHIHAERVRQRVHLPDQPRHIELTSEVCALPVRSIYAWRA